MPRTKEEQKAWYQVNKAKVKAMRAKRYRDHTEQLTATIKAWQSANPFRRRWTSINAHSRRRGCTGVVTFDELLNILELTCGYCPACGKPFGQTLRSRWSFDHVNPIELGGEHSAANGQVICVGCNSKKRAIRYPMHEREAAPGWKQLLDHERSADDQTQGIEPAEAGTVSL